MKVHEAPGHASKKPLRVALLIDSFEQPRWVHKIVSDILSSSVATVVLVILNADTAKETHHQLSDRLAGVARNLDHLLYKLYTRVDNHLSTEGPDAFELVASKPLLGGISRLTVMPIKTRFSDEFTHEDNKAIADFDLDVALRFGFRILKGNFLRIPRYGVWSYHHGDNMKYRGGPPAFWEVMHEEPATGVVLQILSEQLDNGHVIAKSVADTDRWSVRRNANRCYWQASSLVLRTLQDVYEKGPCALTSSPLQGWNCYSNPLYKIPTNLQMFRLMSRFVGRYLRSKLNHWLYFNQWILAYRLRPNQTPDDQTLYGFRKLIPPKDRFWADPFPVEKDGRHYIFFEELLYSTSKGHVSVVEVDRNGIVGGPSKVLERPYHLSYPFIVGWEGTFYMIPETSKAATIELYRCTSFPYEWEFDTTLLSGIRAVDTTLTQIDGRWWMFTAVQVEGIRHLYELHLFYADTPLGPWTTHKRNPVRADTHSSRPAGRIIEKGGRYYRPAQEGPGRSMFFHRLEQLDSDAYREVEEGRIFPRWAKHLVGTHTFNSLPGLTVIDGQVKRARYI